MFSNSKQPGTSLRHSLFPEDFQPTPVESKTQGQTVIAHLSDLHFTSETNFETGSWAALLDDLSSNERDKIDVLAVTGDLIDASFTDSVMSLMPLVKDPIVEAFTKVDKYLRNLCTALNINPDEGLVVVPGNHDYRAKGILMSKQLPVKFYNLFKASCRPVLLPNLHVCLFVLDSNTMRNRFDLATGLIERDDLVKFRRFAEKIRPLNAACTRVVLLHHHPMPIPARENDDLMDNPGFSLLKNAGQFMSLMVEARVDLVLHGHEHHPAFSKAFFPDDKLEEHMITIIGAGSAGKKVENYNLITITHGGQMRLERRARDGAGFRHSYDRSLGDYADVRRAAFEGLAEKSGAKIRARKYSEMHLIKSGSGDTVLYERLEDVTAFKGVITETESQVNSDSGFFLAPKFENISPETQEIKWEWKAKPEGSPADDDPEMKRGRIIYQPALNRKSPITYEFHKTAYNLFHFYQEDREDSTNGEHRREWIEFTFKNAFDLYVLTVRFPKDNFPDKFYREVHGPDCFGQKHDANCTLHPLEQSYFDLHFSKFKDSQTFVVSIEKPLPGYTYFIKWDLPQEEYRINFFDRGKANEMIKELLLLTQPGNASQDKMADWFKSLREGITKSRMWRSLPGTNPDQMDIFLYTYNGETADWKKRGLVCVASTLPNIAFSQGVGEIIKPGQTLIGAAYRRKEPMIYSPIGRSSKLAGIEYDYRIPKAWAGNAGEPPRKYQVVCAVPLYYPVHKDYLGRKVAVLAFASTSDTSRLLNFVPRNQTGLNEKQIKERAEKRDALTYFAMTTLFLELAQAIGVEVPEPDVNP
jgi:predicted MPP superfamily phosphohydrolase